MKYILNMMDSIFTSYTLYDMENNIKYKIKRYLIKKGLQIYDSHNQCVAEIKYVRKSFKLFYWNIYYKDKLNPVYTIGLKGPIKMFKWIESFTTSKYNWHIKYEKPYCYWKYNIEDDNGIILAIHNVEKIEDYKLKKFILDVYDEEHLLDIFIFDYIFFLMNK